MHPRLQILSRVLLEFTGWTTYHGLLHIFLSKSRVRQTFWLLLLVAGLSAGVWHTVETVRKFKASSVTSQIRLKSERAVFPDVTVCNLKPASTVLSQNSLFKFYAKNMWNNWKNWFNQEKQQRPGETRNDHLQRLQRICRRQLQVLWVSADTRDIAHMDRTMLLQCSFNGKPCSHKNFSLVQTNRFWNCYTFHPDTELSSMGSGGSGAELSLVLFTDGTSPWHAFNPSKINYRKANPSGPDYHEFCTGEQMESNGEINQILAGENMKESNGVRIFIHESRKYPLHSTEFVDVAALSSVSIQLRPMRNRLLPTQRLRCSEPPLERANYVRHFAHASQRVVTQEFTKSVADFVVEAKQKLIKQKCGCYSHLYPFQVNTSQLCYYAPMEHWVTPTDAVLANIRCHDEWHKTAEQQSSELVKQFQSRKWCDYWRFKAWQQSSSSWPPFEVLLDIWNDLIVPQITSGSIFLESDGLSHHIMNVTRLNTTELSRETWLFLFGLLKSKDPDYCRLPTIVVALFSNKNLSSEKISSLLARVTDCLDPKLLAQKVAAVRIGLQSPAADLYEEAEEFHWTEALSEIGGTMGLWLGISVLSALELLELLYVIIDRCVRDPIVSDVANPAEE